MVLQLIGRQFKSADFHSKRLNGLSINYPIRKNYFSLLRESCAIYVQINVQYQ